MGYQRRVHGDTSCSFQKSHELFLCAVVSAYQPRPPYSYSIIDKIAPWHRRSQIRVHQFMRWSTFLRCPLNCRHPLESSEKCCSLDSILRKLRVPQRGDHVKSPAHAEDVRILPNS